MVITYTEEQLQNEEHLEYRTYFENSLIKAGLKLEREDTNVR